VKKGFTKSISIAGDLLYPSDEEVVWLVKRYDLVIEERCEANANPPACYIYFKPGGPITEYLRFFDWVLKEGEPLGPSIAVFISSETEREVIEKIKAVAEKRGMRVVKTDFPEMGIGYPTRPGSFGPRGRMGRPTKNARTDRIE
jgi:hypothetical protein